MNPLSKALVLVVAILTVVLSAFTIAYVGAASNYHQALAESQAEAAQYKGQLLAEKAQHSADSTGWAEAYDKYKSEINSLRLQLNDVTEQMNAAKRDKERLNAELAGANAAVQTAVNTLKNVQTENNRTSELLVKVMNEKQKLESEKVECLAKIAQLDHENRQLSNSLEQLKEQSMAFSREAQEAKLQLGQLQAMMGTARVQAAPVAAAHDIEGTVSAVRTTTNGICLVSVNIGSQDHVVEGMQFTLARGGTYLGTLVITSVDGNTSFGRLTDTKGAPGVGDTAYIRGLSR